MKIGPSIKTDGLILHLDASSYKSYPQSGNIWYDLSGNEHHAYGDPSAEGSGFSDARFPVWQSNNGGRFYFDGSDGLTILTNMGTGRTAITMESFCQRDSPASTTIYFADARNGGGAWWLTNYSSHNINVFSDLQADDPVTYQASSNWWEKWIHLLITSDGTGSKLYIDGKQITDSRLKLSNSTDEDLGQYFRIGNRYTSSGRWRGYFGNFRIYDHALTTAEVEQNFNAQRRKYGL